MSYATLPYFGINSFKFYNAKGAVTFGRYQLRPVAGEHFLTQEQLATARLDYLTTEIRERVRRSPAKFKLMLQVAEKDDQIDDPIVLAGYSQADRIGHDHHHQGRGGQPSRREEVILHAGSIGSRYRSCRSDDRCPFSVLYRVSVATSPGLNDARTIAGLRLMVSPPGCGS